MFSRLCSSVFVLLTSSAFSSAFAAEASQDKFDERLREAWYYSLTPTINSLSKLSLLDKREKFSEQMNISDANLGIHEGNHQILNPRYKEWWYFDAHTESGLVISAALVRSIVNPHYFLWVYDPKSDEILLEIEQDGELTTNSFGTEGLDLKASNLSIKGRADQGYTFRFDGKSLRGTITFTQPIAGRGEVHRGPNDTAYGLYQIPSLKVSVRLEDKASGVVTEDQGLGYHDHWWGNMSHYTKWAWTQVKFTNGWVAGFYDAHYGFKGDDLHRYAWLYRPGQGYTYFDTKTLTIAKPNDNLSWVTSASGKSGSLQIYSDAVVERYQFKKVQLFGVPLGEVRYRQYPVRSTATFTDESGVVHDLTSEFGFLEWDWDAVW